MPRKKTVRKTDSQIKKDKTSRIMNIVAKRCAYYRANPHRYVEEVLGLKLRLFQKILIYAMMHYDYFLYIASRGQGKTYLTALFCVVRCILYPGTKCIASSCTLKQSREILLKITDDFMKKSTILCTEIEKWSTGQNDGYIYFRNGSWIRLVVANQNARGSRCNILLVDEARMVSKNIIETVLQPMLSSPRTPGFLSKPKYIERAEMLQEMNKELYLSSAWYQQSELYERTKSYVSRMLDDTANYFVCALPYQLPIKEGLLMRATIENKMAEPTFDDISFMMEYEAKFYGSSKDSLFKFNILDNSRSLLDSYKDLDFYRLDGLKLPPKQIGEKRILSLDVALLASRKHDNDASAFIWNCCLPTSSNDYISNIVDIETKEGLVTDELGLLTMRYFYQYDMDYLALDANGIGQAIFDYLIQDRYDPVYGITYGALNCCNNDDLATRCKNRNAKKVIYAIKANAKLNNDMCLALRAGFQNGNINLLISENNIDEELSKKVKGYNKMNEVQKTKLKLPYMQTSFLINELINLEYDTSSGLVKVKERSGMRKDRYSSLEYNYYVAQQLALQLKPKNNITHDYSKIFTVRAPRRVSQY